MMKRLLCLLKESTTKTPPMDVAHTASEDVAGKLMLAILIFYV